MSSYDLFNRIEITGLFGNQNETIEFTEDDHRVKVLYGLNGSGKTTVLRLIEAAIRWNPIVLWQIEFDSITFVRNDKCNAYWEEDGENYEVLNNAGLFGFDPDAYLWCISSETYSIKRTKKDGNPTTLTVTCDVTDEFFGVSEPQGEWIASNTNLNDEWNYEKVVEAPGVHVIRKGDIDPILEALDTLHGIQPSKKNDLESGFSSADGSEYSFDDILTRFIPPDMFPRGYWNTRPDPTSRFLQLPIQESAVPDLVLMIPDGEPLRSNKAALSNDFEIKFDDIGDFKSDALYHPNYYRNMNRPNYPVSFVRADRLTSLMRSRDPSFKVKIPTIVDAEAIQRLTEHVEKYNKRLLYQILMITRNFTDFVLAIEKESEVDGGLGIFDDLEEEGSKRDIQYKLGQLLRSTNVVLEHWDEADSKIRKFGLLIERIQTRSKFPEPLPPGPPTIPPIGGRKKPSECETPLVNIAEFFPHASSENTPTMQISSIASRMNWLERLTTAISLLNLRMDGKNIKLSTHGKGLSVKSDDGRSISVHNLSSGEMQMLLIFIYLVDRIGHQRHHTSWGGLPPLVLIDEPELSMHISWQRGFIDDLMDIFFNDSNHYPTGRYHRPQFIIATHSPSIVANHMHRGHELRALGFIENLEM